MSCNGCRVLRKGCSDECMLKQCLQWIENPQAQGHATLFVAKFFGRATLMSFLSSVPANQRSAMFGSLMYEAVGRSINPVNGAVGLLWTGNWHLCQMAVEKVLRGGGGALTPLPQFMVMDGFAFQYNSEHHHHHKRSRMPKRKPASPTGGVSAESGRCEEDDDDDDDDHDEKQRQRQQGPTPSEEDSHTTTFASAAPSSASQPKLLPLFF